MKTKPFFFLLGLALLFILPASAQNFGAITGACPGEEDEEQLEVGDVMEGRLRNEDRVWYTFEAEAGDIWRIEMLGDSSDSFRIGILDPEARLIDEFENEDLFFSYLINDDLYTSAFRTQLEGVYCLLLQNEDTDTVNYEVSLEPFPRNDDDELRGIDDLDDFGLNTVGIWYYIQERYPLALEAFEASLEIDPEDYVVQRNACTTAYLIGLYEEAVDFCDAAIEIEDTYADAYRYRAFSYRSLGEYDEAADDFDELIDLQSDNANWYFERSLNSMLKGDFTDALDDMEEYMDMGDIENPYWRGVAELYTGELDDARDSFEDSVEQLEDDNIDPIYQNIWLGVLGDLDGEDEDDVDELFQSALDSSEGLDEIEINRVNGLVALLRNDMESAQAFYQDVLDERGLAHDRILDLAYIRLLNVLYPDNLTFFAMLDWFEAELGL
jgi:tetratricopeptide (TPR) repeat protein